METAKKIRGAGRRAGRCERAWLPVGSPVRAAGWRQIVERLPADARHLLARLFVEDQLPSSNEYLRERFSQGAGHGEVCFVELQTAGRGRRGRVWSTPWGQSLMVSMGWRFESGINALEGLSLAVGVVVSQVLEQYGVHGRPLDDASHPPV